MKVLHVITGIDRGGAENHLFDLVRHQRTSGMDVTVAYLRGNGYWAAPLRELGAEVHALGLRFYGDLNPLLRLLRVIRGAEFDLVHAHLPPAELYVRLALLGLGRRKLPMLITKHNEERFCEAPGQRALGRWVGRKAVRVIAISEAVKRFMAGTGLGLDQRNIETIYYGIDAAQFGEVPAAEVSGFKQQWGIPKNALIVGFVGRLVEQKDIGTLIRGFALFSARFPEAWLVIVGEGPCKLELQRCANELGIADRVVWAGFRADIQTVMRVFDIFALTSIYEGLGLVLLEAMASSAPVAATRVGAIPEVVADGETGLLIGPGQPAELAAAFHQLGDGAVRARMGEAGRQRVLRDFTLERMWQETDALYARVLVRARGETSVDALSPIAEPQPE